MERKVPGILHGLQKFHHYCFAHKGNVISDHKLLVAIFKKDMAILSHRLQGILLRAHQYNIRILYKPEPQLFIRLAVLSRHNYKTEMKQSQACSIAYNTCIFTCTPDCMMAEEIRLTILDEKRTIIPPRLGTKTAATDPHWNREENVTLNLRGDMEICRS